MFESNKNKNLLVSIITPNYNGDKFLEECIKSVINQSSKDYEYIIIDGGSTDESKNIIKKYEKFIKYFVSEKDNGLYDAIDKGIKKANGEIILWINSDDMLDENAVSNVIKIFKNKESLEWITGINGYIKKGYKYSLIPYYYPSFIIRNGFAHQKYWGYIQQESIAFKKKLYLKSNRFKTSYGNAGDFHLWRDFANLSKLSTFFIKIGYFRTWQGQNSQVQKQKYEKDTGILTSFFTFKIIRLIISLIFLPYIILKTFYLSRKNKL